MQATLPRIGSGSFTFSWGSENDRGQATIFKGKANWASADNDYQAYELDDGEFDKEATPEAGAAEELLGEFDDWVELVDTPPHGED